MSNSFETLSNEILIMIFSNFSWFEILESFWSINQRINSLICSLFSMNNHLDNNAIVFNQPGLSYEKCSSLLLPIITNSLSLSSAIRRIHMDELNSASSDFISKWFSIDTKQILRFSNLKSLVLTRFLFSEALINSLSMLIEFQLDELRLTFDKDLFISFDRRDLPLSTRMHSGNNRAHFSIVSLER